MKPIPFITLGTGFCLIVAAGWLYTTRSSRPSASGRFAQHVESVSDNSEAPIRRKFRESPGAHKGSVPESATDCEILLREIMSPSQAVTGEHAIHALGQVADAAVLQRLADAFDDPAASHATKERIIRTVEGMVSPAAAEALSLLVEDPNQPCDEPLVCAAARALAVGGTAPGVDTVLAKLDSAPPDKRRDALLTSLMELRSPAAETTLLDAANGHKGCSTGYARAAAVYALRACPSEEVKQRLNQLRSDAAPLVAAAAAECLSVIDQ